MLLTVSKRLEFSASRRLYVKSWSDSENLAVFGPETSARYGTGRNYVAYFVFTGAVDSTTGMLMNISEIKSRVENILHDHFDHKFLNTDSPVFADLPPTMENISRQLFASASPLFADSEASLVVCHLQEAPDRSATYYASGVSEANHWFEFSAARQTMSPHLTNEENEELFGAAASPLGHGHHYRARLSFQAGTEPLVRYADIKRCIESLRTELDHKSLNHEVPGLKDRPITTEVLAQYIHERTRQTLPIQRIRLHERDDFFAEYWDSKNFFLGMRRPFSAAHRLHAPGLSLGQNRELYGKCNNPNGHGHQYLTEATISGSYDERTGTVCGFSEMESAIDVAIAPWQDKHLDLETQEFRESPSTGENIVRALWPKMNARLNDRLVRLRLRETANNRFTLRKT